MSSYSKGDMLQEIVLGLAKRGHAIVNRCEDRIWVEDEHEEQFLILVRSLGPRGGPGTTAVEEE